MEIHLPEFWDPISGPIFPNKGDQERFWRMTRRFMEQLSLSLGAGNGLRAVRACVLAHTCARVLGCLGRGAGAHRHAHCGAYLPHATHVHVRVQLHPAAPCHGACMHHVSQGEAMQASRAGHVALLPSVVM